MEGRNSFIWLSQHFKDLFPHGVNYVIKHDVLPDLEG